MAFMYICIGLLGLIIGSFLNVCICRIPQKQSIAFPPSHCMSCGHKLNVIDLFPVFSYIFLKGKCRYCSEKISIQYPTVELLNCLLYLVGLYKFGINLEFVFFVLLSSLLIVLSLIDIKHMILPNILVLIVFILSILYMIFIKKTYMDSLWGFLIGGGFFLLLMLVTLGNMGGGDIKLMAALGVWLGLQGTVLTIAFAFIVGAVVSVILMITKKADRKSMLPFGPFICLGSLFAMTYGSLLIDWYFSFFEYL